MTKASFKRGTKKRKGVAAAAKATAEKKPTIDATAEQQPTIDAAEKNPTIDATAREALPIPADMPLDAMPQGPRKGRFNYTVFSRVDGPKIEVQLKNKCFFVKKSVRGTDAGTASPVYSWSKLGSIAAAWNEAAKRAGWYGLQLD